LKKVPRRHPPVLHRRSSSEQARKPDGTFDDCGVGFVHVDTKHRLKQQHCDRVPRKRSLSAAIERGSRSVHLTIINDEIDAAAVAFLTD
jgi:hypothetical protein